MIDKAHELSEALTALFNRIIRRADRLEERLKRLEELDLPARVERLEDHTPIHITGNTEDAQRAIASLVAQLDDANAHIRRLTAQENAA